MVAAWRVLAWLSCPIFLVAQDQAGLQPDWDIGVVVGEMSAHATRLLPTLDKVNAKAWIAKGASETYSAQLQASKDQARAIARDAEALRRNPEKLSKCLELYLRIDGMEQMINSLVDGIRKYQDPALAGELASLSAENGANRNRFQAYIVSLASQQEQECAVMDQEAQRCRSIVATQPPPKPASGRKK
jgi:hypothetical protein